MPDIKQALPAQRKATEHKLVADLEEGTPPPNPFLGGVKNEEMTEGRKAGWTSKLKPGPLLSSKSESATDFVDRMVVVHQSIGRSEIQQGTGANFKF